MTKLCPRIPIFAYHQVEGRKKTSEIEIKNSPFSLNARYFKDQMRFLAQNGYKSINLYELLGSIEQEQNDSVLGDDKLVVITFDDGWADNYENAYPILTSFGLSATFFIITGRVGSTGYMSWAQLREMQDGGMQIESHTHSHTPLELLSNEKIKWELTHSRQIFEDNMGKQVGCISLPHGSFSDSVLEVVRQSEYVVCCTSRFGCASKASDPYVLPRIMVKKTHNLTYFQRVSEGRYFTMLKGRCVHNTKDVFKNAVGIGAYNRLYKLRHGITRKSA